MSDVEEAKAPAKKGGGDHDDQPVRKSVFFCFLS